jgi:hypothetical protein
MASIKVLLVVEKQKQRSWFLSLTDICFNRRKLRPKVLWLFVLPFLASS